MAPRGLSTALSLFSFVGSRFLSLTEKYTLSSTFYRLCFGLEGLVGDSALLTVLLRNVSVLIALTY